MTSAEFTEFLAYFTIQPWPEERADINHAIGAMLLANINRDSKTVRKPFEVQDFIVDYWKEPTIPQEESTERMKATMETWGRALDRSI